MLVSRIIEDITKLNAKDWNALGQASHPFLRYEFLRALEQHECLHPWGWSPRHLCLFEDETLIAAAPMYSKTNSYGEFVFDWAWAEAYNRNGLDYYPKLVVAVPYTPVTGPRLLISESSSHSKQVLMDTLINSALKYAQESESSSLHWLFTEADATTELQQQGFMQRTGCQFHWRNNHYQDFDDFLAALSSKKRKQIRRERREVAAADIEIEILHGDETEPMHWQVFHEFYRSTFIRKSGYATLTQAFFEELAHSMPRQVVLVMAKHKGEYVAATFNMRSDDALYGRHWGCNQSFSGLHFELCYYQLIDYCIREGLRLFEAGAQGEHKLSRGFLPTPTYSAHWLANPDFSDAIENFLNHETAGMQDYMDDLNEHSPFRHVESK